LNFPCPFPFLELALADESPFQKIMLFEPDELIDAGWQ